MTVHICKDCKHCIPCNKVFGYRLRWGRAECDATAVTSQNLVTGEKEAIRSLCSTERRCGGACGIAGALYEPKEN